MRFQNETQFSCSSLTAEAGFAISLQRNHPVTLTGPSCPSPLWTLNSICAQKPPPHPIFMTSCFVFVCTLVFPIRCHASGWNKGLLAVMSCWVMSSSSSGECRLAAKPRWVPAPPQLSSLIRCVPPGPLSPLVGDSASVWALEIATDSTLSSPSVDRSSSNWTWAKKPSPAHSGIAAAAGLLPGVVGGEWLPPKLSSRLLVQQGTFFPLFSVWASVWHQASQSKHVSSFHCVSLVSILLS